MPLERSRLIITKPEIYSTEEMGLIKIDLLSQCSLDVLKDAMVRINNTGTVKSNFKKAVIFPADIYLL